MQERLYFFQFPNPLPEFFSRTATDEKGKGVDHTAKAEEGSKTVTFSEGTKPPAPGAKDESPVESATGSKIDGVAGQLEVYESGAVKMRFANGIVMDVSALHLFGCLNLYPLRLRFPLPHNHRSCNMQYTWT